jgi:hypothetical protein
MNSKQKDIIDEALKLVYLEHADLLNDEDVDKEILKINATLTTPILTVERENMLLSRLAEVMNTESLGQAISHQLAKMKISIEELSKNTQLPTEVVQALIQDDIYTNNVPIQLFKKLLEHLKLNISIVERSIKKTLQLLGEKTQSKDLMLQPAFRKGFSRGSSSQMNRRTDGKELYENAESMEKYISRLKELMR